MPHEARKARAQRLGLAGQQRPAGPTPAAPRAPSPAPRAPSPAPVPAPATLLRQAAASAPAAPAGPAGPAGGTAARAAEAREESRLLNLRDAGHFGAPPTIPALKGGAAAPGSAAAPGGAASAAAAALCGPGAGLISAMSCEDVDAWLTGAGSAPPCLRESGADAAL